MRRAPLYLATAPFLRGHHTGGRKIETFGGIDIGANILVCVFTLVLRYIKKSSINQIDINILYMDISRTTSFMVSSFG